MSDEAILVLADAVKELAAAMEKLAATLGATPPEKTLPEGLLNRHGEVWSKEKNRKLFSIDMGADRGTVTRLFNALSRPRAQELAEQVGVSGPLFVGSDLLDVGVLVRFYGHLRPGSLDQYGATLHSLLGSWVAQLRSAA